MANADVQMTLDQGIEEVLALLTGMDVSYSPAADRYHVIARCINRAMRAVALEHEWSYFHNVDEVGTVIAGQQDIELSPRQRLRLVNDDAIRLIDSNGRTVRWAYVLPSDALHKYPGRVALYCSVVRSTITFSRPFLASETGLRVFAPVMREPRMFDIPPGGQEIPPRVRNQGIDFDYPDLVTSRAAFIYAQTDPVMQPRVQNLEAQYKDIMYQLVERDERHTDSPYMNDFIVPIQNSINGSSYHEFQHAHPHADGRWR